MKLYNSQLSPYATRVRMQLYLKGINAELVAVPAGGSHTPEYAKMNPLEKIPTLDDNGFCAITEADVAPGQQAAAREGANNCPERAITIVD